MKKKLIAIGLAAAMSVTTVGLMTGCGGGGNPDSDITLAWARESGSGTRDAFDELVVNSEGQSIKGAGDLSGRVSESSSTANVITSVAQRYGVIGYISMGSLLENTDKVTGLKFNGVEPTTENVLNDRYTLSRPFVICYRTDRALSDLAQNFISFIESTQGQEIISDDYINVPDVLASAGEYTPYTGNLTTLNITGSTSVDPLMKKLADAFAQANPGKSFDIKITGNGSGTGIADAQAGNVDFGMSSRALKDDEKTTLTEHQIATDGIAVIVKRGAEIDNVTSDQLFELYMHGTPIVVGEQD